MNMSKNDTILIQLEKQTMRPRQVDVHLVEKLGECSFYIILLIKCHVLFTFICFLIKISLR